MTVDCCCCLGGVGAFQVVSAASSLDSTASLADIDKLMCLQTKLAVHCFLRRR